jgi:riboflavin synthase
MFTGLIEAVGEIVDVQATAGGQRLHVTTPLAANLAAGESLAVNGVCLTMTATPPDRAYADIGPETARVTTLGSLRAGQRVNLERAMRADSRFGGHFVQGHVDGTGTVTQVRPDGDAHWVSIAFDEALAPYVIPKGSIAVDGVSLTVAALAETTFQVMIIPFTWEHTTMSALVPGSRVNIECDMIGKYVAAQVARLKPAPTNA